MARLPIPGSDNGTWGNILNEFLTVEHNSDGTLKASGSLAAKADQTALDAHITTFNDHNARHEPGGADALDFTAIHQSGTLALRPAAAAGNNGLLYLATDDSGGTTYRSNGSAWVQMAPSVSDAINWRDTWAGGSSYAIGDAVFHAGSAWIAITSGTGNTPQIGSSQWSLMAQTGTNAQSEIVFAMTSANFSSASTTYVDVTGVSIAPNTTAPIYLEAGGLVQIGQGTSSAGTTINLNVQIIDDQSTVVALSSFKVAVTGTALSQMMIRGPITPNSTSRTYKVQAKIDVSTGTFLIWGSSVVGVVNGFHIGAYTK